jgi:membrane-bound lytic murein transglycosylase D
MSEVLLGSLESIPAWSPVRRSKLSYVYHRVSKGETLSSIAERYKTTVAAISKANNIRSRQLIKTGQRLKIPFRMSKRR